ncbi:MAG: DUF3857 domain-containing protein [Bacteroidales bacterium]|nr:DUF3857 domain-containing protein [Bacteroidales bacterium]
MILFSLLVTSMLYAQKPFIKYGKVSDESLTMNTYPMDSLAEAVVLGEYGFTKFRITEDDGWQVQLEKHVRIKILKKEGLDYGNYSFTLFHTGLNREETTGISGLTFNMENGKEEKSKLGKEGIFYEEVNDYVTRVKLAMPNVKVGSVIDIRYSIVSDFISYLFDWDFQYQIPVVKSLYTAEIPRAFNYKELSRGYISISRSSETVNRKFQYSYSSNIEGGFAGGRSSGGTYEFEQVCYLKSYAAENVPAFRPEPHMNSINNYLSAIDFELTSYNPDYGIHKNFTTNWEAVRKQLIDNENFGTQLKRTGIFDDEVSMINTTTSDEMEKIGAAYELIRSRMSWNGYHRLYAKNSLRSAFKEGSGNSADINLMLVVLLRALGFDANPVILSTRDNGMIIPGQVMLTKYNFVIAAVKINDQYLLLDATDKNCPLNMLPPRCLNGMGRIISEDFTDWIDLNTNEKFEYTCLMDLKLDENAELTGKIQEARKNYAAYYFRNNYKDAVNEEAFIQDILNSKPGLKILNYTFTNIDSLYNSVESSYEVNISDQVAQTGNLLHFTPLLYEQIAENPFKLEDRKYPVDFIYPQKKKYILSLTLPEGFTVDELPENLKMSMPDKSATFLYSISAFGNTLNVVFELSIDRTLYTYEDYKILKQFYQELVKKQGEKVVIKNNT